MSGHTPGPWSVQIASGALVIFGDSTMPRTIVARVPNKGYPEVALHDARLIAAAPMLLEALIAMRTVMDMGPKPQKLDAALSWRECDEKARSMCDEAIAAATGDSSHE